MFPPGSTGHCPERAAVSKRDLLIFLFKWKASILGMLVVVLAAASLIIFVSPPSYSANSKILVERTRPVADRRAAVRGESWPASRV